MRTVPTSKRSSCQSACQFTFQIFPDAFTRREIMGLHLHCPNEDCDWAGTNKDLQVHKIHAQYGQHEHGIYHNKNHHSLELQEVTV